jgi:hypothetical protein
LILLRFVRFQCPNGKGAFGATCLFELFRLHYHGTPADLLTEAQLGEGALVAGKAIGTVRTVRGKKFLGKTSTP